MNWVSFLGVVALVVFGIVLYVSVFSTSLLSSGEAYVKVHKYASKVNDAYCVSVSNERKFLMKITPYSDVQLRMVGNPFMSTTQSLLQNVKIYVCTGSECKVYRGTIITLDRDKTYDIYVEALYGTFCFKIYRLR